MDPGSYEAQQKRLERLERLQRKREKGPEATGNNGGSVPGKHRRRWTWGGRNRIQWTVLRPAKLCVLRMRAHLAFPPDA